MAIEIAVLGSNDAHVLTNVAPGVFDNPIDLPATSSFLGDPRCHLVVALEDGSVVAFVSAVHYVHPDKPRPELWINEASVAPTHQGRGLGKALMASMLDAARKIGCGEAWVLTDRSNGPAMRLYASTGGIESDQVMFNFHLDLQPRP
jgi:GNAT superfamily N-acetyltransferase